MRGEESHTSAVEGAVMPIESSVLWACVAVGAVGALVTGGIGAWIGGKRNSTVLGFLLGLLFGPIGILITLLMDQRPPCPECRELVDISSARCPFCGKALTWQGGRPQLRSEVRKRCESRKALNKQDVNEWEQSLANVDVELEYRSSKPEDELR